MRAFTSWRVTRSRASMLARSTLSITATWSSITSSGQVEPEVVLRPHDRDPELPLEHDLPLRRPDVGHGRAGVAGGQDVREVRAGHRCQSPICGGGRPPRHPGGPIWRRMVHLALPRARGSRAAWDRPLPRGRSCAPPGRTRRRSMLESCEKHPHEMGVALCRRCGHSWCSTCLVYSFGPKKPPFCMSCAMFAGGVRTNAAAPRDAPQAAQGADEGP